MPPSGATIPAMPALLDTAGAALMERATLFLNHVLSSEPIAVERLRAHAGKRLEIELRDWPALLPKAPALGFEVTRAGLVEWQPERSNQPVALRLGVDASNPALVALRRLAGERPAVEVQGDAAFAADVSWLIDNLRWDVRDDLARFVGPVAAQGIGRVGRVLGDGLREALRLASRWSPARRDPGAG